MPLQLQVTQTLLSILAKFNSQSAVRTRQCHLMCTNIQNIKRNLEMITAYTKIFPLKAEPRHLMAHSQVL